MVNSNLTIAANFSVAPARTLTITTNGPGTVTKSPDKPTYLNGETVTLTAVPNANASFLGWDGALTGATSPTTLVMDGDKAVTANFAENIYTLALAPGPNGTITASPNKLAYYQNEVVTLTAAPAPGYSSSMWFSCNHVRTSARNSRVNSISSSAFQRWLMLPKPMPFG